MEKKKIKVTSRGMVITSRGRVRTPIGPYIENVRNILAMITRNNATVVEVLPDGKEVTLTIQNFDKDNSNAPAEENVPVQGEEKKEAPAEENIPAQGEEKKEAPAEEKTPVQEPTNNRQLSRKERKKQEYERKVAEAANKQPEATQEQKQEETPAPEANNGDTVIPTDAIEN